MCAITLENKHRGTWGVWRHLLALLGWQHRVALQHFHVEKHYLAHESLLWVTLLPFKQWEVRTVTKLKTYFIRTGHCSTSWRGGEKWIPEKQLEMKTRHLKENSVWCLYSGTDILTKSIKGFFSYVFARQRWDASIVYSFALELHEHKEVTWQLQALSQGWGSSHCKLFAPLIAHVRSKPARGSAYFLPLSI